MTGKRIDLIDALRGLAVVLMVIHHFFFDLVAFLGAPAWLFTNPVFDLLHYVFAGVFILLSGVSSRFSRSNLKRGVKLFAIALALTLVTWFLGIPIWFGILHLLAVCMFFYGLTEKSWDKVPPAFMPLVCVSLTIVSAWITKNVDPGVDYLWMFGWAKENFVSADYFPIFPWIFIFLLGTWAGKYIVENRLPKRFYEFTMPVLPQIGRKALIIYLLHQPVLYLLTLAIWRVFLV